MYILFIFGFGLLFCCSLLFRCCVTHPISSLIYAAKDSFFYFRYRRWREAPCGELNCYAGLFGKGKTLSMVMMARRIFKKYDGKLVYDRGRKLWVKQNIIFLSNIKLVGIPYIPFENLNQYVDLLHKAQEYDLEHGTITFIYMLGDEFSVQMNSRNFKSNLNPDVLNSILTCRHYHSSLYYTSQRFQLTDKLLRDVTQNVVYCKKWWRIQRQYIFDAFELENSANPELVKPRARRALFIFDRDFAAYDTLACVDNLSRDAFNGDMLSELEILQLRAGDPDLDNVSHLSRKGKKLRKSS